MASDSALPRRGLLEWNFRRQTATVAAGSTLEDRGYGASPIGICQARVVPTPTLQGRKEVRARTGRPRARSPPTPDTMARGGARPNGNRRQDDDHVVRPRLRRDGDAGRRRG